MTASPEKAAPCVDLTIASAVKDPELRAIAFDRVLADMLRLAKAEKALKEN